MTHPIEVNERVYPGLPSTTAIVICLDGSQKEYLDEVVPKISEYANTQNVVKI